MVELGQLLEYQILGVVGILILINHYVLKARGYGLQSLRIVPEEDIHIEQDVVEIHHAGLLELQLITLIQVAQPLMLRTHIGEHQVGVVAIAGRRNEVVLCRRDARENVLGLVDLVVESHLLDADLDRALGIGSIVYGKILGIAQEAGVFTEKADEHGVEGTHHQSSGLPAADHQGDALFHLVCRFLCKGKGEDGRRIRAFLQYVCNAARKNPRLSGTGAGDYQGRPLNAGHRLYLFFIQPFQNRTSIHFHHYTMN